MAGRGDCGKTSMDTQALSTCSSSAVRVRNPRAEGHHSGEIGNNPPGSTPPLQEQAPIQLHEEYSLAGMRVGSFL